MEYVLTGEVNFMAQVLRNGIIGMWEFGQFGSRATFPDANLAGLGRKTLLSETVNAVLVGAPYRVGCGLSTWNPCSAAMSLITARTFATRSGEPKAFTQNFVPRGIARVCFGGKSI